MLIGDGQANHLTGLGGSDAMYGLGGDDAVEDQEGSTAGTTNYFFGGPGGDILLGGPAKDIVVYAFVDGTSMFVTWSRGWRPARGRPPRGHRSTSPAPPATTRCTGAQVRTPSPAGTATT